MSLGIFSFDLAALINSLSNFMGTVEPELVEPTTNETSLDKTAVILQNVAGADSAIDDALMGAALNSAVSSIISTAETVKKVDSNPKASTPVPVVRVPAVTLDEETKREIEQLIRSLQTSVIHSYQSTDIIDETVSLNSVANFPKRELSKDSENKPDNFQEDKKREEDKLRFLQEELRKAIMKNNSDV